MEKLDILKYVMNTPNNTNRAVLESMLNGLESGESTMRQAMFWNGEVGSKEVIPYSENVAWVKVHNTPLLENELKDAYIVFYASENIACMKADTVAKLDDQILSVADGMVISVLSDCELGGLQFHTGLYLMKELAQDHGQVLSVIPNGSYIDL